MEILELYKEEQKYWKKKNIDLFGINPIDEKKPFAEIQASLDKSCEKYWNTYKPCKLAELLNDGTLDHDSTHRVKNTYRLKLNPLNMCVDVYSKYQHKGNDKEFKVCSLPTPEVNLDWIINKSHYTPRVTAFNDVNTFVSRHSKKNSVSGEWWTYDIDNDEFKCVLKKNPFEATVKEIFNNHLSKRSKAFLQSVLKNKPLTEETFTEALKNMPVIPYNSVFNYKFSRFEYFEDIVINSKKYAFPTKDIILGINSMFISQAKQYTSSGEKIDGQLILTTSPIFSLENFRTVINIYKGSSEFTPAFTYTNAIGFFDSFKTATSSSAGRQRLLLDNVVIKDGMLLVKEKDGTEHNMFEYMDSPQDSRISCLSYSPFCHNNQAKRIMMTAKLSSQAVSLKNEKDPITHRIPARVIFADVEGYTYGDSIIISKSFAEKLRTYQEDIVYVRKSDQLYKKCVDIVEKNSGNLDAESLSLLYPTKSKAILDNFNNAKIKLIDESEGSAVRLFITYNIPMGLGDKISNLHGAKGTVGLILPDEKMPQLLKQAGNMEPGAIDVIISGFSTIRRGSLGQIFEAWANANDIKYEEGEDFINTMVEKYGNQMKKFSQNSVIEFNGEKNIKPIGIIDMIRVYHHASTHISESSTLNPYNKMLRLGEMEKLNLLSSELTGILKELSIRSMQKYSSPHRLIKEMQDYRELPDNPRLHLKFAQLLKSIGYDIKIDGNSIIRSDTSVISSLSDEDLEKYNNYEVRG